MNYQKDIDNFNFHKSSFSKHISTPLNIKKQYITFYDQSIKYIQSVESYVIIIM